jgi:hypothetical protein
VELIGQWFAWARDNVGLVSEWAGISIGLWVLSIVVTLLAVRYYLIWLPADFFAKEHRPLDAWRQMHPLGWVLLVVKNIVGAALVLAGLVMLVTPGPGWLALLIGLALVDLPGKRTVERKILRRPTILRLVDHMRAKAGQPPLDLTSGSGASA